MRINAQRLEVAGFSLKRLIEDVNAGRLPIAGQTVRNALHGNPVRQETLQKLAAHTGICADELLLHSTLDGAQLNLDQAKASLGKVQDTTPLRRLLARRISARTAEAIDELGGRHLERPDESAFFRSLKAEFLERQHAIPGTTIYALCGSKSYEKAYVRDFFRQNIEFVKYLHEAEEQTEIEALQGRARLTRLFLELDPAEATDLHPILQMHHDARRYGVLALVIPRTKFDAIDEIEPDLQQRLVGSGLGFVAFYSPPITSRDPIKETILHVREGSSMRVARFGRPYVFDEMVLLHNELTDLASPVSAAQLQG